MRSEILWTADAAGDVQQMPGAINRLPRPAPPRTTQMTMSRTPAPIPVDGNLASTRKPAPRTAYLVLGMHRSGTSAVTQLLALAGCALPANVMPGDEHNAKGYFEPWKIAIFNDERLRAGGSAWDDIFAYPYRELPAEDEAAWRTRAGRLFDSEYRRATWPLVKDPRATVLAPMWLAVLAERGIGVRVVIPVRHPLAVAGSLTRRDGFAPQKSVLVWSAYMLAAEAYTRDLPRAFVGYDALLADWRAEVARIEAAHGAPLPRLTLGAAARIDAFLTPELRHNAPEDGLRALGWAGDIAQRVHSWFEARAAGGDPDRTILDHAAADLAHRQREIGMLFSPAARDLAGARAELLEARQSLEVAAALETELRHKVATLEAGWRADQAQLAAARALIAEVDADLTAVLKGE